MHNFISKLPCKHTRFKQSLRFTLSHQCNIQFVDRHSYIHTYIHKDTHKDAHTDIRGDANQTDKDGFMHFNLNDSLVNQLLKLNISNPTPIQQLVIPKLTNYLNGVYLHHKHITAMVIIAETGSGKTLSYLLPTLSRLMQLPPVEPIGVPVEPSRGEALVETALSSIGGEQDDNAKALIIVPNSTLASQTTNVLHSLLKSINTTLNQSDILITTAASFIAKHVKGKHHRSKQLMKALKYCKIIVIDEADFVLAGGNKLPRELLHAAMLLNGMRPFQRKLEQKPQCFFIFASATYPPVRMRVISDVDVGTFVKLHFWHPLSPEELPAEQLTGQLPAKQLTRQQIAMDKNPYAVDIVKTKGHHKTIPQVQQYFEWIWERAWNRIGDVSNMPNIRNPNVLQHALESKNISTNQTQFRNLERDIKLSLLEEWCQKWMVGNVHLLVFCFSNADVTFAHQRLTEKGYTVTKIQSSTQDKQFLLEPFYAEPTQPRILVASDILARGIDLHITHVLQMDMSKDPLMYLHRIGRTARMGREGLCCSFVGLHDARLASALIKSNAGENLEYLFRRKQRLSEHLKALDA
jgi:superfamily II DNA/RNA helicase